MADRPSLDNPSELMAMLRRERLKQDVTFEWLAERVGVKYQSLQAFEAGKASPTEVTLRKWLLGLRLPEEWTDQWIEYQIGEKVRQLLRDRRGPRAATPEDIEAAVRYVRRLFGR